ncbi:alpha-(1,3)-fucosyltransferase fut-1-like isoform X2 [Littorina saxatilis]
MSSKPTNMRRVVLLLSVVTVLIVIIYNIRVQKQMTLFSSDPKEDHQEDPEESDFQALHREMGIGGKAVVRPKERERKGPRMVRTKSGESFVEGMFYTHDDWPQFHYKIYNTTIPKSPYDPPHAIQWDFNVSTLLQRPDVKGRPPKLIMWMAPVGYLPQLPEPVRLRTCPEMPCRMTTNAKYQEKSAALLWNAQSIRMVKPPERPHPDQVFIFHNQERPTPSQMARSNYRTSAWRSVFNWTMSFRFDSDILDMYGYLSKRPAPVVKNYTTILARKTQMAAWMVSHCKTTSRRDEYVKILQKYLPVHIYGQCGPHKCARSEDDKCFKTIESNYKFLLAFENALCKEYITEKFFRYMEADLVLVVRGGAGYEKHAPRGTYINTADFKTIQDLSAYLQHLDKNPEEYLKILRAKDQYVPMYEEYPHRDSKGRISFMHYHYEAVAYCELCRRLWNIDRYRKSYPDMTEWFDKGGCAAPKDIS